MKQATEISLWARRRSLAAWAALLLLILGTAYLAVAQETTGTIAGNVSDSTGAGVVGAKATTTNTQTNIVRSTVTDSAGQYTLPSLPAGTYSLSVEMNGFQGQNTDSIFIDASQAVRPGVKIT